MISLERRLGGVEVAVEGPGRAEDLDPVELAGLDSFPASDPPAWTLGREKRPVAEPAPAGPPGPSGDGAPKDGADARGRQPGRKR